MSIRQSINPMIFVSFCLCVSIWSGSVVEAAIYYVAKTGNNQNSCGQAQNQLTSKATIKAALACLSAGDTLAIGAGTYAESLTYIPSNVTIEAITPKAVTLRPSGGSRVVNIAPRSHNIILDGLVLDGSNVTLQPVKIRESSTHIALRNGVVKNSRHASCIIVVKGTSIVLSNLEIYNCNPSATSGPGGHGIYWHANDSRIENCRLHGLSGYAIQFYNAGGAPITGNTFRNNTIYDARRKGAIFVGASARENLISNNTIDDVRFGIHVSGHHNSIVHNNIDSTMCAIRLQGANNTIIGNTVSSSVGASICR